MGWIKVQKYFYSVTTILFDDLLGCWNITQPIWRWWWGKVLLESYFWESLFIIRTLISTIWLIVTCKCRIWLLTWLTLSLRWPTTLSLRLEYLCPRNFHIRNFPPPAAETVQYEALSRRRTVFPWLLSGTSYHQQRMVTWPQWLQHQSQEDDQTLEDKAVWLVWLLQVTTMLINFDF